jgi:hypothetical protein
VFSRSLRLLVCLFGLSLMLAHPPATQAATLTVTSTADSGTGTLRQAIADAAPGDTINFSLPALSEIVLTSGQLEVNKSLNISGPGSDVLTVTRNTGAGSNSFRIFFFAAGTASYNVSGLTISGGNAGTSSGGGILNRGNLNLSGVRIYLNTAATGGGLYNSGTMNVTNSTILLNRSITAGGGGGLYNAGSMNVTASEFASNTAETTGAAIFNEVGSPLFLVNSTISDNFTTINTSAGSSVGGAFYTRGYVSMTNCTITANFSSVAGGIYISPTVNPRVEARNTIIAKNTAAFSSPDLSGGTLFSLGYNLFGNSSGATIQSLNTDQIGTNANPLDPLLGDLSRNGGATRTRALLSGSPAIDRGGDGGVNTDQRGLARPVDSPAIANASGGDGTDIGAYEVQSDLLPGCNTINLVVSNNNDSGAGWLRGVMANACAGSTITFASNVRGFITLTSNHLSFDKSLTINGPGANLLTIQRSTTPGTALFRIFISNSNRTISTISGLTLVNGNPGNASAGAIYNGGTMTIINSTVSGNQASDGGGTRNAGTMTIIGSTFSGNAAVAGGGGIRNDGTMTMTNSTISTNSSAAGPGGGGILSGGTLTVISSTISGNSATNPVEGGGGLYASGTVTLRNTLIALNTAPTGPNIYGTAASQGFNLVGNNSGANISSVQFSDLIGTPGSPVDPLLGPLQDNGGATRTHALLSGSPAIDRGHSSNSSTDQRGLQRPFDLPDANAAGSDASDIGAFEAQVNCDYAIAPTFQTFPAGGGAGFVSITTPVGCAWTAVSNSPFLSVTSGASGSGGGSVGYSVAANPNAGQRSGVITIAGKFFVANQDGTAPIGSTIQFGQSAYSTSEGAGSTTVTVTRSGDLSAPATIEYATTDGTANDRGDYNTTIGRLRFAAGENSKAFIVLITNDAYAEGAEGFNLTLSNPTGGAALGATSSAAVTINDNDATTSAANPLDTTSFFVRQQYVDFFSREPDAGGLAFWSGGIDSCGTDTGCREVKRIDTSAAFFLSIEFQETGFLAHRLYRAAFARLPRYREFVRDTQEIGRGVVVNSPGWEAQLEANKAAFLNEFATRADFQALYAGMTNAQYIDALNANAAGSLSQAERDALLAGLSAGTETRATALRKAADDADFRARETSRAFVLMQYFGYLRRNPDDAPDSDFAGYNFWLGKLNEFDGDYRRAEMVRAFLVSTEYRRRFGQ